MKGAEAYLDQFGAAEWQTAASSIHNQYDHVLVIPVYRETLHNIDRITVNQHKQWGRLLTVLVFNSPVDESGTAELMHALINRTGVATKTYQNHLINSAPQHDQLIVDRCSPGHEIAGVGPARKLGADIALALVAKGLISDPFIYCTDADVELPEAYFSAGAEWQGSRDIAARIFPFVHQPTAGWEIASYLYEISMHYYVLGLAAAGSPNAYHSLGSTIAIHSEHYAKVRGFPSRDAGEDFYLLNKLNKTGRILTPADWLKPDQAVIKIEGRPSDRVPFGTGPGLSKAADLDSPLVDYRFYHPQVFIHLGTVCSCINNPDISDFTDPLLQAWSEQSGFNAALARAKKQSRQLQVQKKAMHDWFDGLKTLKLIHYLRDQNYPSISLKELSAAPFLSSLRLQPAADEDSLRSLRDNMAHAAFGFIQ